jgi:hypothetical protein
LILFIFDLRLHARQDYLHDLEAILVLQKTLHGLEDLQITQEVLPPPLVSVKPGFFLFYYGGER